MGDELGSWSRLSVGEQETGSPRLSVRAEETIVTKTEGKRCLGRVKARELTKEEMALVGGGDTFHSDLSPHNFGEEGGCLGCTYT